MPLTPAEAAAIAAEHRLSLADAAGLRQLADTVEEASDIAARFARSDRTLERTVSEIRERRGARADS